MVESKTGSPIRKRKENATITLSPYLKKQLDVLVDSGEFSSLSDLSTMAFSEFLARYNAKKEATGNVQKQQSTQSELDPSINGSHLEYVE